MRPSADVDAREDGQLGLAVGILRCPACGYSLHGIESERCPECGQSTDLARAIGSDIPWAHRASIGRWRAFWRTAWRFAFRGWPARERLPAYVDFADARRFAARAVGAFLLSWAAVGAAYAVATAMLAPGVLQAQAADAWYYAMIVICWSLALVAAAGAPSYLFHPKRLTLAEQNRAVALTYYAAAPLAWIGVALPLIVAYVLDETLRFHREPTDVPWTMIVFSAAAIGLWWFRLVRLACAVLPTRFLRWRAAILTPVSWLLVTGLLGVLLPGAIFYAVLLVYSLQ